MPNNEKVTMSENIKRANPVTATKPENMPSPAFDGNKIPKIKIINNGKA